MMLCEVCGINGKGRVMKVSGIVMRLSPRSKGGDIAMCRSCRSNPFLHDFDNTIRINVKGKCSIVRLSRNATIEAMQEVQKICLKKQFIQSMSVSSAVIDRLPKRKLPDVANAAVLGLTL